MVENYDTDDTFLARWLGGTLSEEERLSFEKTDVYKQLRIINRESQLLEGPIIDVDAALKIVKQKINTKKQKPKVIRLWYAVTAAAIIIVSLSMFLNASKTYTTGIGEKMSVTLEDGSVIDLNANSSLSHKRFFWTANKEVNFTGEGYFTITKSKGFSVNTSKGKVEVLGTVFNIKDRTHFELKCYEGKINFVSNKTSPDSYILTKGMQIKIEDKEIKEDTFVEQRPDWKTGVSKFVEQPLSKVLEELTHIYPITFQMNTIDANRIFTGSFKHNNLNDALQTTLTPMGVTYQKASNGNVIILSE
ncbi:hypothetical protein BFR04_00500 [Gaetbulibacter sp. 4G1]|nr:FecR family protein [Gaetbulibacter sp. 4G1]PIA79366.1 hypothetical protein BFR04_00500 [Gaetbulibacter sp. 4G1]